MSKISRTLEFAISPLLDSHPAPAPAAPPAADHGVKDGFESAGHKVAVDLSPSPGAAPAGQPDER